MGVASDLIWCISIVYTESGAVLVTSIQRWGNSLAVRIPKAFAEQARLSENSDIDISIDGDTIVIAPAKREWHLDELVKQITPRNRHNETAWGDTTGKEAW